MEDFPAAHSMDMEWFAVDRDGVVGVFHSSDVGAVPQVIRSPKNEDPAAPETWWPERTGLGGMVPVLAREELERFLIDEVEGSVLLVGAISGRDQILFPRDAKSFATCRRVLREDRPSTVPLRDGHALHLWRPPSLKGRFLLALRRSGVWRSLPREVEWLGWLWACGFVSYVNRSDQDGDVYDRLPLLPHSVSLAHLPADAAARVGVVRLDCSFREKEFLQPCTYVPCVSYASDRWFDEDGTFHPSGLEDAWRRRGGP